MNKYDKTRLKNLLSKYRNHLIVTTSQKNKHLYHSRVTDKVDNSIRTIQGGI